jgi:CrcB protein
MPASTASLLDLLGRLLLVGVGGGLGSIARYGLAAVGQRWADTGFPLGTLLANVIGCFFAGVLGYFFIDRPVLQPHHRLFLMYGFLGGLTTFSSFGYETIVRAQERQWGMAGLNIAANVVLSLAAVSLGWKLASAVWR